MSTQQASSQFPQPSMDIDIFVERVTEYLNRKVAPWFERVEKLERNYEELRAELRALRAQIVESVIRSVLSIKMEELIKIIVVELKQELTKELQEFRNAAIEVKGAMEGVANRLGDIEKAVDRVAERIGQSVAETLSSQLKDVDKLVNCLKALEEDVATLASEVADLKRKLNQVANTTSLFGKSVTVIDKNFDAVLNAISGLEKRIERAEETIREVKEDVEYMKGVIRLLEERLRQHVGGEEEEESGG